MESIFWGLFLNLMFVYLRLCSSQYQQPQMGHPPSPGNQQFGHPHQPAYGQQHGQHVQSHQQINQQQNLLHDKSRMQDTEHIKEHLGGVVPDLSKMSEEVSYETESSGCRNSEWISVHMFII